MFYVEIDGPSGYIELSTGHVEQRFAEKFGSAIHVEDNVENNELIETMITAFYLFTGTVILKDVCKIGANTLKNILGNAKLLNVGHMPII